nr:protein RADIALIS-like 3 [Tanacetum cinerariifolium]
MQERLELNKTQGALTPEEEKHMQNVPYASAVGSIMYAATGITVEEVKRQYQLLVDDVEQIESGKVPLPNYKTSGSKASYQLELRLKCLRMQ